MSKIALLGAATQLHIYHVGAAPPSICDPFAAEGVESLYDQLREAVDVYGHVIVLAPTWLPQTALRRLRFVRSALETERLGVVPVSLPPLAVSVLGHQLSVLTSAIDQPGRLAGIVPVLERYLLTGAWLSSVANLEHVDVGLRLHVRSFVPGAGFAVLLGDPPQVVPLRNIDLRLPPLRHSMGIVYANQDGDTQWVRSHVVEPLRAQPVVEVPPLPAAASWWGCKRLVEFVGFIADAHVLADTAASCPAVPCVWCGLEILGARCPFCEAVQPAESSAHSPVPLTYEYGCPA